MLKSPWYKALSHGQQLLGLFCIALGLTYYVRHDKDNYRVLGFGIGCGLYFVGTGFMGVCAIAAQRTTWLIAHLVLNFHCILLAAPALAAASTLGMFFTEYGCTYSCDTAEQWDQYKCSLICGKERSEPDLFRAIEALMIGIGSLQWLLSLLTSIIAMRWMMQKKQWGDDVSHVALLAEGASKETISIS